MRFHFSKKLVIAVSAMNLAHVFSPSAQALTLVENGAPRATIVVAKSAVAPVAGDASAAKVSIAARDLQEYVRKMSGATLPIVGDDQKLSGALLLVGKSTLTAQRNLKIPDGLTPQRREEGFLISSRENSLALAGNDSGPYHGTEYAVYDLLERLGVRWFMPGEFGEVVPQKSTLTIGELNVTQKPDFIQRNWWLHTTPEMLALETRWKIRNKMNPDNMFAVPGDSSVRNFVAASELAKTEPELFAKGFDGSINVNLPNLTNPKSVQIAAEKAKEYFRKNPNEGSLGIAPDDGLPRDFNLETVKRNQGFSDLTGREGVPTEMSNTEEWIEWVNAVTREVNKEFPDRIISTNGYSTRNMAPFGVDINPNISIMFAAIWSDTLHAYDDPKSWQMVRQGQLLKRWAQLNDKVWVYNYDYTMLVTGLTPLPQTRKLARDMPLMKKWGVVGFNDETRNIWAERGITTKYIKARLEWDADADVKALLEDYFAKWYGAAAKPSRAFWDALEEQVESTPVTGHEDRVLPWLYTPDLMAKLSTHLVAAEAAATAPREKLHVQIDRLIYEHLKAYVQMNAADLSGNYSEAARHAAAMLQIRPQLHAINSFLMMPSEKKTDGSTDYNSGAWYWTVTDRAAYYQKLADMLSGKTGNLVAMLPDQAAFSVDPKDEGRFAGWYETDWSTQAWQKISMAKPFYLQGHMDAEGRPYMGNLWYQFKVDVPALAKGKQVLLYAPVVEAEAWTWVNGKYVGHRPYRETYERPNEMELDVTNAIRPGQGNVVSIRISTSANRTALAGGLTSRLFLYSPKPEVTAKP